MQLIELTQQIRLRIDKMLVEKRESEFGLICKRRTEMSGLGVSQKKTLSGTLLICSFPFACTTFFS